MALLGLLLLPSDYRAGAEAAHPHALAHLWADAADGVVHHHHAEVHPDQDLTTNWFSPEVHERADSDVSSGASLQTDVGHQQDTAPAASGPHFLVDLVTAFVVLMADGAALSAVHRRPAGRIPRVLLPPPRSVPAFV